MSGFHEDEDNFHRMCLFWYDISHFELNMDLCSVLHKKHFSDSKDLVKYTKDICESHDI